MAEDVLPIHHEAATDHQSGVLTIVLAVVPAAIPFDRPVSEQRARQDLATRRRPLVVERSAPITPACLACKHALPTSARRFA